MKYSYFNVLDGKIKWKDLNEISQSSHFLFLQIEEFLGLETKYSMQISN